LHVAVEDGEDLGVPLDLIAEEGGEGRADGAVQLADDDLGLGTEVIECALDERFAGAQDDAFGHGFSFRDVAGMSIIL
jgi:hypothetical protein